MKGEVKRENNNDNNNYIKYYNISNCVMHWYTNKQTINNKTSDDKLNNKTYQVTSSKLDDFDVFPALPGKPK